LQLFFNFYDQYGHIFQSSVVAVFADKFVYGMQKVLQFDTKLKTILVTACGGLYSSETLRLMHFLEDRCTEGSEVVSLTIRPPFTSKKIRGDHFC
jgi:hypothetical protein